MMLPTKKDMFIVSDLISCLRAAISGEESFFIAHQSELEGLANDINMMVQDLDPNSPANLMEKENADTTA